MKCPHREDIFWTVGHKSSETSFTEQKTDILQYILQYISFFLAISTESQPEGFMQQALIQRVFLQASP